MRLDRFDLNLLVVLDVLLEECSVTRASQRLHLGQSATSAALARLREYFEDELLVQVGRRLVRTAQGEALIGPVREALQRSREAIARKPRFDPATAERRFVIRGSDYAATVILSEVVRRVAALAPSVRLDVRRSPLDVFEKLERGHIDLLFMPEPYVQQLALPRSQLFEDGHVCVVCRDNPAAKEPLTFERYLSMGHVAVYFGDERSVAFEEWCLPRWGRQRRVELVVDNFTVVPQMLVGTDRIATLHRRQAEYFAREHPVVLLDTPFDMPPMVLTMLWPQHLDLDPAHEWLRGVVHACVRDLQPTGR